MTLEPHILCFSSSRHTTLFIKKMKEKKCKERYQQRMHKTKMEKSLQHVIMCGVYNARSYFIRKHAIHHFKWLWKRSESLKLFNGLWCMLKKFEEREIVSDYRDFPLLTIISGVFFFFFRWNARDSRQWIFHLIPECLDKIASSLTFVWIKICEGW